VKLLIYDLDGTLVNTREDIVRAANHMLQQMGQSGISAEEVSSYVGKGLYFLIKGCLKTEDAKKIEKGSKIYRDHYAAHMMDHSSLYPGAREILEYFKNKKQAVITNKPNPFSYQMLKALGVADYFVEIVAGDSDYPKKPDPGAVLAMMQKENVLPGETVFIGDSAIDIQTGRNAGIKTVVVTHGFSGEDELKLARPDAMVRDFSELLELARKENW